MTFTDYNKQIGGTIRARRKLNGLSQAKLAAALNVDNSYISTLERGMRNPSVKTLEKIARALDVTVTTLVETSPNNQTEKMGALPYIPMLAVKRESVWRGREWYHQRFDGSPYLLHMIAEAEITTLRDKKYDLFFDRHFCFFEDGKADWYIDLSEIARVTERIMALSRKYPQFGKKIMKEYAAHDDAFYEMCRRIEKTHLHRLSNHELIQIHNDFIRSTLNRNSSSSIIDGFALGTDRILEEKIKKAYDTCPAISNVHRFPEVFSILTAPAHSSFIRDAELEFFQLILKIRARREKKQKLIRAYRDRYFWIKNNYVDAHTLTTAYFEEEIARIESSGIDADGEIARIEKLPVDTRRKKTSLLKKLTLDKEIIFLLSITEDFTRWQDERKKATLFTAHYATAILDEIARRVNIPFDLIKYLSPREIPRIFTDTPSRALLEERRHHSVAYWDEDGHEIISGKKNVATLRKKLLGEKSFQDVQDFRGISAALGKAQGKVRIIRSVKEVHRVEKGDVLVAVMTRPDYVPAMKKAVAIVTDEGGITSHAAIVSRELEIPCVIGTKIATHTLHDGDFVEVNANHGLVKILKRATAR